MKTKELKIQDPEGYEIDKENSTLECIKFKPIKKDITYKEVCDNIFDKQGYYINSWGIIKKFNHLGIDKINNATNEHQLERLLALNLLLNIAEYYNKLHPEHNGGLKYITFEDEYGYFTRQYDDVDCCFYGVVALFNKREDAQAVIDNPNFREILDTIYKE